MGRIYQRVTKTRVTFKKRNNNTKNSKKGKKRCSECGKFK